MKASCKKCGKICHTLAIELNDGYHFGCDKPWFVYIVCCSDYTYYTGATNNVEKRIQAHNNGVGARYTKSRRPVVLMKTFECPDKSSALKLEYKIKQLPRAEKLNYKQ